MPKRLHEGVNCGNVIQNFNQRLIFTALSSMEGGEIAIVWDRVLMRQFDVFVSVTDLSRNHRATKNFSLEKPYIITESLGHVAYFVAPLDASVDKLIKHFPHDQAERLNDGVKFHVFFVPEPNYVLTEKLKTAPSELWTRIGRRVRPLACHWFPDDQPNHLHMNLSELPVRMLVDGNWNFLYKCATALAQFRRQFLSATPLSNGVEAVLPYNRTLNVYCKGEWAIRVVEMMKRMPDDLSSDEAEVIFSSSVNSLSASALAEVDTIVIVDRWLDLITPMLTQFTLGGALDDLFGIDIQGKTGITRAMLIEGEEVDDDDADNRDKLNIKDSRLGERGGTNTSELEAAKREPVMMGGIVYERLHDLHLYAVAEEMRELLKELNEDETKYKWQRTIAECKNFVAQLSQLLQRKTSADLYLKVTSLVQRRFADDFFVAAVSCEQEILNTWLTSGGGGDRPLPFIENAIVEARLPHIVLRLVALQSLVATRGLRPAVMAAYRKAFIQSYGIFTLRWWLKLQMAGIIREDVSPIDNRLRLEQRYASTRYSTASKRFRLLNTDVDEIKCSDSSYAYNGRASLLVRYVEEGIAGNWRDFTKIDRLFMEKTDADDDSDSFSDTKTNCDKSSVVMTGINTKIGNSSSLAASLSSALGELSGRAMGLSSFSNSFRTQADEVKSESQSGNANIEGKFMQLSITNASSPKTRPPSIMLFVIGGITRSECAAFRRLYPNNIRICATTSTITAKSLLESFK